MKHTKWVIKDTKTNQLMGDLEVPNSQIEMYRLGIIKRPQMVVRTPYQYDDENEANKVANQLEELFKNGKRSDKRRSKRPVGRTRTHT